MTNGQHVRQKTTIKKGAHMKTRLERFFEEIEALHTAIDQIVMESDHDSLILRRHLMIALEEYIRSMGTHGELL